MKRPNADLPSRHPLSDARLIGRRIIDDPTFHQASRALLAARVRAQLMPAVGCRVEIRLIPLA
jgi:hypothetical protein